MFSYCLQLSAVKQFGHFTQKATEPQIFLSLAMQMSSKYLFFPENRFRLFMKIVTYLHEMSNPARREIRKYHKFVVCWISPGSGKG